MPYRYTVEYEPRLGDTRIEPADGYVGALRLARRLSEEHVCSAIIVAQKTVEILGERKTMIAGSIEFIVGDRQNDDGDPYNPD